MTPILYEKDEIDFTSQGLGSLVEIYDVDVEEQRNGLLQLTASYPVSGVRYADISVGRIILAKPNQRDDVHAFRIVSTELDISGYAVNIEADSITYDLTHNVVKHLNVSGNGQEFMSALKRVIVNPSIFEFYSDISTASTTSLNYVNPMEAIMGSTGSFLQIWGGELKRENRRVAMFNRRGRDNVATFRLGKNIAGLKYSVDISSLVTRIVPTKSVQNDNQTTTTLEGTPVDSRYINNYEQIYTLPLEFTDDTIKTVADLNAAARGWFTQSANTGRDKPTVTIDIDVLSLQDSADYQDKFKNLESVSLSDTVTVYVPEYGVNVMAVVNELHYDPILDRVTKLTVGTAKQSFADSSRTQLSDLQDKIISVQNQADAAVISANGKSRNYYGSVEPSHPQEGDIWFWIDGDKSGTKVFVDGEWVDSVDSDTQAKIAAGVDDAIKQAKSQAAAMDEVRASEAAVFQAEANAALSSGAAERAAFSSNATSMTNSAASRASLLANSAAAYGKAQAANALSSANDALTTAKQELGSEVSKAQSDIVATNKELSGKVSQADFDTKIGDLTTKYGQVKTTADAVTAEVTKYETANDKKVSANTASINVLNNQITSKVSQTDFDKTTGDLSGKYSVQQQTINGISQTVTELQAKANAQGQVNQLMNTEFTPDLQGWTLYADKGSNAPYASFASYGSRGIGFNTVNADASTFARLSQTILLPSIRLSTDVMSLTWRVNTRRMDNYCHIWLVWQDVNGVSLGKNTMGNWNDSTLNKYNVLKWENISIPIDAKQVDIRFETREGTNAYIFQPMVSFTNTIGDYVSGNYNNNARVAELEVGLTGITGLVMDPKNGLSATATLAANGLSVATKAQSDATTAIQTAKGVQTTVESMGQVNHLNNSEFDPDLEGWDTSSVGKAPYRSYFDQTVNKVTVGFNTMNDDIAMAMLAQTVTLASTPGARGYVSLSWQAYTNPNTTGKQTVSLGFYDSSNKIIGTAKQADWSDTSGKWPVHKIEGLAIPDGARTLQVMFYASEKVTAYLAKPMLAFEKTIGTYTPSNYNNNATVESIHTQLAGQITDEIQDRTTGDKNTLQQSKDYTISQIQSATTGYQSAIEQSAEGIMASVSQVNRLFNTQFTPDLQGWNVANNGANGKNYNFYRSYIVDGETTVGVNVPADAGNDTTKWYSYFEQDVAVPGNNGNTVISLTWDVRTITNVNYNSLWFIFKDANGKNIDNSLNVLKYWSGNADGKWYTKTAENIAVPTNAKYIRVSFQCREGTNAYLKRPMLTFTPKAQPYMPGSYMATDTILQLFKDHWAIGIQDNTFEMVSGIIGDNTSMNLISNNITLQGTTTVTEDFYAKGGNFKNLNASNITTGTINAEKINVINLDVSSLSGNITNFVKSYWDGAYGEEVSIQSDRITFYTNLYRSNTTISEGKIDMTVYNDYTKTSEHIGGLKHGVKPGTQNQDYLIMYLDGWRTQGGHGDDATAHGGDGFMFSVSDG
ncbi:phage tail spike protein [Weissella paramesenteroides]|uniref:phage tail spike protein n=1 Tax=Weissella paramesenteroides TaxID=1249 RepID=UPI003F747D51